MSKNIIAIIVFLSLSISYSQDMSKIKVEAIKLNFNTSLSEISCSYVDGSLLYFQNRRSMKKNSQFYDLFMLDSISLNSKGGDRNKVSLTKQLTIVTSYHEGPCFVDEVNNRIYITINSLDKKGMKRGKKLSTLSENRLRLLEGDFKDGLISNLKEFTYNNPVYSLGHAAYSNATKRLYFVSTMPGSLGESDIFYCSKKADGSWGKPVNLGKRFNSIKSELFPFVKNGIIFFSSNGQRKQVGRDLDFFFVKESEISTKFPTELVGANTNYDDYSICFNNNAAKFEGYFTSNRNNGFAGNDDIYGFRITNVEYEKTYNLLVKVSNEGAFFNSGNTTLIDDDGNEIKTIEVDKKEFNFSKLDKGKKYKLAFNNDEFSRLFDLPVNYYSGFVTETLDIESDAVFNDTLLVDNIDVLVNKLDSTEKLVVFNSPIKETAPINTKKNLITDKGILVSAIAKEKPLAVKRETEVIKFDRKESFESIYFTFDSYTVYKYSQNKLDKLIKYANDNNAKYIILHAYTDAIGSTTYNEKLSVKRALSARDYLIKNGIPESKIKYQGFGENNLVSKCGDGIKCKDIEHSKNRRIEFIIAY
jgi:outer membrane protein OmpA-like peptidoglycan-associated protein